MQHLHELQTLDAKTAAKRLRDALAEKKIEITHGECLDLLARQLGIKNWNVLSAKLAEGPAHNASFIAPEGWVISGENYSIYEGGLKHDEKHNGLPVFLLQKNSDLAGFATVMQAIEAAPYVGKRLRFSGDLKTTEVLGSATIWMRADDRGGKTVTFNNLEEAKENGSLKGSTNWVRREVVLDIPEDAVVINFGFYLSGRGQARYSGFNLETVDETVPLTIMKRKSAPTNLTFAAA